MQNVVALHLRRAVARHQRIGKQRDRVVAFVLHLVFQGEQIAVVDRDGAAEDQACAVVIGQRHRMADAERARALLLPHRVRSRHRRGGAGGGHPAELGVERLRRARRREQHDGRRVAIDGLAILLERQIVDAPAFEVDAAVQRRRGDGDARRSRNHRLARCGCDRGRGGAGHWRRRAGAGCGARRSAGLRRIRLRRAGLGLRLFLLLELGLLALLFHLRIADEILPADDDDQRQHDGKDGVLVIAHSMLMHAVFGAVGVLPAAANLADVGTVRGRHQLSDPFPGAFLCAFLWAFLCVILGVPEPAPGHESGRAPYRVPAASARTAPPARRAVRSAHNRGRHACRRRLTAAPSRAASAAPGCAPPHCRPAATP